MEWLWAARMWLVIEWENKRKACNFFSLGHLFIYLFFGLESHLSFSSKLIKNVYFDGPAESLISIKYMISGLD